MSNINTVGELKKALADYPDDLVIEHYGLGDRAVSLQLNDPTAEEIRDGCYKILLFCGDTLITHRHSRRSDD